jgi:hypothetical protein
LRRLEILPSAAEMTQMDYDEAWAWTYFLVGTTHERRDLLRNLIHEFQRGAPTPYVSDLLGREGVSFQNDLLSLLDEGRAQHVAIP